MIGLYGLAVLLTACAEDKIVKAADAKAHVNEKCVVEFTVKAGRFLEDRNMCFLNSETNFRDAKNFTVVIFKDGMERFKEMKIENPFEHYKKKKVRVTGKIELRDGKPQIRLLDPSNIKIVDETKMPAAKKDAAKDA